MKFQLRLRSGLTAVFVSAYAPTLTATENEKEAFYESLNSVIQSVPFWAINSRVGRDFSTWPKVLGHHYVGNENPQRISIVTNL